MAVIKAKPTSAGRRFVVKVVDKTLYKGRPNKALIEKKKRIQQNTANKYTGQIDIGIWKQV